jgi:hypothetical protein
MSALLAVPAVTGLIVAGAALAWWSGGPPGRPLDPSPPLRVLVLAMLVLVGLGSIVLAAQGRSGGPLLVGGAFLALGAGAWLGQRTWGRPLEIPVQAEDGPVRWPVAAALGALGLLALGSIVARSGLPLFAETPFEARAAFSGLVFDVFRWLVPSFALLASAWALARPDRSRLVTASLAVGGVVALEVLLASRALPFELALGIGLLAWWNGRRVGARVAVALVAAGLVFFLGVLLARMGPEASFRDPLDFLAFAADRTVGRVVMIQPESVDAAVQTIPAVEPYWAGATYLRRIASFLGQPDDHPPLGEWLYARMFPGAAAAFAAPGILAEGWVNAGLPLALGLLVLVGLGAQWFGSALGHLGTGPADRAAAALVTVAIARTYATSLNGFLLTLAIAVAWWVLVRPGGLRLSRDRLCRIRG